MWRVTVWVLRAKHSRVRMASAEMDAAKHLRLVLQGFMSYDYKGEQRLHADDFPKALQSLGLKFGDPVVDTVMPLCQIDADSGFVRSRTPDTPPATLLSPCALLPIFRTRWWSSAR